MPKPNAEAADRLSRASAAKNQVSICLLSPPLPSLFSSECSFAWVRAPEGQYSTLLIATFSTLFTQNIVISNTCSSQSIIINWLFHSYLLSYPIVNPLRYSIYPARLSVSSPGSKFKTMQSSSRSIRPCSQRSRRHRRNCQLTPCSSVNSYANWHARIFTFLDR